MSILDRFLNAKTGRGDSVREFLVGGELYTMVKVGNPVNWGNLGKGIAAGIIAAFTIGAQTVIAAVADAVTGLLRGGREFLFDPRIVFRLPGRYITLEPETGLIPQVTDGVLGIIDAVWAPFTGLGWLAFPVAVAGVLASLYPVVWALSYVEEEVV